MTKIIFPSVLLLMLSLCSIPGYAQSSLSVGPVSGFNVNFYNGSGVKSNSTGFGLVLGGIVDCMVTPNLGMLGRLLYDNKSGSFHSFSLDSSGYLQDSQNNISLAYVTIDALFKYRILTSGFSAHAGPSLVIPIHGTNEQTTVPATDAIDTGITTINNTKTTKTEIENLSTRFELKFGVGYDIPISKSTCITLQTSYGWGLSNVKEEFSWKISSWQTTVGVKFDLSGKGFR